MKRLGLLAFLLLPGGCSETPLGYLSGSGTAAKAIASLGWGLLAISIGVCIVTGLLLLLAIFRRRNGEARDVSPVDDREPIRWIIGGVAVSVVFLVAAAVWTLVTVAAVGQPTDPAGFSIDVTSQQWWWSAHYIAGDPSRSFTTADQLVLPVGIPVRINLRSKDVIHSFWVPKLGGKMDMIPSRTNVTWLEADAVGDYRGQCGEFCGLEHASMAFDVHVVSKEDFERWWDKQLEPALTDQPGLHVFMTRCSACHTVRGTEAGGILGPDLSHFGSRSSIGAGLMNNTKDNLVAWINNTQTLKPGVKMPELHLSAGETNEVASYLEGLK